MWKLYGHLNVYPCQVFWEMTAGTLSPKHSIHPIHHGLVVIDCFLTALVWHALWTLGWDMCDTEGASLRGASALGDLWRFDFRSSLHQGTSHHRWSGLRGISESFLVHLSHFTEGNQTPNQLEQLPNKIGRTEVLPPILISFGLRIQNITCNHFILFLRNLWDF